MQLCVRDVETTLERPRKELKAFGKVKLEPGETGTVTLPVDIRSFAHFDDHRDARVADRGDFKLLIGQSGADLPLHRTVRLGGEWLDPVHKS